MKKVFKYASTFLIVVIISIACKAAATSPPRANIDSPLSLNYINNSVTIKGWSICTSGVKRVTMYINSTKVGTATTGILRSDVNKAFNSNGIYVGALYSGFSYVLSTSSYPAGTYSVKIVSTGKNGSTVSATSSFTKASPKIHIDYPGTSGLNISSDFKITGWSLNQSGVKKVDVAIDGNTVGSAQIGISRVDVNNSQNTSGCYKGAAQSGLSYMVKYSSLTLGSHTVVITSLGNDGSKALSTFTVKIIEPSPISGIDTTSGKLFIKDSLTVTGWSLNVSGVKSVQVYIGDTKIGSATIGLESDDINTSKNSSGAYKDGDKSGFTFTLSDTSAYTAGNYTVKVVSTGNNNTTSVSSVIATMLPAKTNIDKPSAGSTVQGDFTVSGWAVNAQGVNKVQILMDGSEVGTATIGISRGDVKKSLDKLYGADGYKDADLSGFSYDVNLDSVANGSHKVTVRATGAGNGSVSDSTITIKVAKVSPIATIDTPKSNNAYLKDTLTVTGWSVCASGVKDVQVYLDGDAIGSATIGLTRTDVNASVNKQNFYKNATNSGYSLTISKLTNYKSGVHTVKIVSTGNDGDTVTCESKVNKVAPISGFDSTKIAASSNFTVSGWALNATGISKVEVYYGTTLIGTATPSEDSLDIQTKYDKDGIKYSNVSKSRFELKVDVDSIPYGSGTILARATGNDGETSTASIPISVVKAAPLGCIDTPANGQNYTFSDSSIVISGWSLNASGVKTISVYLDGTQINEVTTGIASGSGIIAVSAGRYEGDENARFATGAIDISKLSYSKHTVKVLAVGNDGGTYEFSNSFYRASTSFTSYNITVAQMATKTGASTSIIDPEMIQSTDSAGIYEFMTLNYVDGLTADELNTMLVGRGVLAGKGQAFLNAGKTYNINPVYLIAHARVESGNGTSKLSAGIKVNAGTYTFNKVAKTVVAGTYYNQFGINAIDTDPLGQGSKYAAYCGWNSVDASISGGAAWIAKKYIWGGSPNQDTIYEMRFDPGYWDGTYKYPYQYATSKTWAHSIALIIEQYKSVLDCTQLTFDIPKYK